MSDALRPVDIKVNPERDLLTITFEGGEKHALSAEYLRVMSTSAEVRGHSPSQRITVWGKRNVRIADIAMTGSYAIRIRFDDGHDTGIYTWSHLAELGRDRETIWARHLAELEEKGLKR